MNTPPPLPITAPKPRTGLSLTSFVLGLLSLGCFFLLTGLPAIITGHVARARAKKNPQLHGGAGLALAGLILGYLSILTTIAFVAFITAVVAPALAVALPNMARGNQPGPFGRPQNACVNNLKQIGLAARVWSNDHGEKFPPDLRTMSNELISPLILICPGDKTHTAAADWTQFDPAKNSSYEFLLPDAKEADAMMQPAFRCRIHGHVALGDGSVQESGSNKRRP